MKKMKKLFAMLLTLAMVFGMSMNAFAAKDGATLTVKGLATNAEQIVKIYEIYRLNATDNSWEAASWTDGTGVKPENLVFLEIQNYCHREKRLKIRTLYYKQLLNRVNLNREKCCLMPFWKSQIVIRFYDITWILRHMKLYFLS